MSLTPNWLHCSIVLMIWSWSSWNLCCVYCSHPQVILERNALAMELVQAIFFCNIFRIMRLKLRNSATNLALHSYFSHAWSLLLNASCVPHTPELRYLKSDDESLRLYDSKNRLELIHHTIWYSAVSSLFTNDADKSGLWYVDWWLDESGLLSAFYKQTSSVIRRICNRRVPGSLGPEVPRLRDADSPIQYIFFILPPTLRLPSIVPLFPFSLSLRACYLGTG